MKDAMAIIFGSIIGVYCLISLGVGLTWPLWVWALYRV